MVGMVGHGVNRKSFAWQNPSRQEWNQNRHFYSFQTGILVTDIIENIVNNSAPNRLTLSIKTLSPPKKKGRTCPQKAIIFPLKMIILPPISICFKMLIILYMVCQFVCLINHLRSMPAWLRLGRSAWMVCIPKIFLGPRAPLVLTSVGSSVPSARKI